MAVITSVVRMNDSSHGHNSYANNSTLQRTVISKTRTMVEIDLPTNDFNSVFMSLPHLYSQRGGASRSCYISGTPGSFYGRLFPSSSLHFVHSSYSLHWLSQVPAGIENNKGHIYMAKTSPSNVFEAYLNQFQSDFGNFLSSGAMEMKPGGAMTLTFIGRSSEDPTTNDCCLFWELLSKSLLDMAAEGVIEESDVHSFNIPNYYPSRGEVKEIVEREGSFKIDRIESFQLNWGTSYPENEFEEQRSGENMSNCIRVVAESMLTNRFGEGVMEDVFGRYTKYVSDHLAMERTKFFNIVVSMFKIN